MRPSPMIALIAALTLISPDLAAAKSLTETRMQLQAALQRNLGRSLIDGALRHVDLRTGEVADYFPVENHEMILRMGEVYVMCATLITADGEEVTVDYYMVDAGGRFAVIRAEIDNRAPLRSLMQAGKAIRLE